MMRLNRRSRVLLVLFVLLGYALGVHLVWERRGGLDPVDDQAYRRVAWQPLLPFVGNDERVRFFDEFVSLTMRRRAWSPGKWESLGTTWEDELRSLGLREAFAEAESPSQLDRAFLMLLNSRRDSHLKVDVFFSEAPKFAAIRFLPDLSEIGNPEEPLRFLPLFVANYDSEGMKQGAKIVLYSAPVHLPTLARMGATLSQLRVSR